MNHKSETKDPSLYKTLAGHLGPINSVCFSNDDKTLYSGSSDGSLMCWELKQNPKASSVYRRVGHSGPVTSVDINKDDSLIATGSFDHSIRLWKHNQKFSMQIYGHLDTVSCIDFNPTTPDTLLSGSHDGTLKIWSISKMITQTSLDSANKLFPLTTLGTGHTDIIKSCSFSPDGTLVSSSSADKTVKIFDSRSGSLFVPTSPTGSSAFSLHSSTNKTSSTSSSSVLTFNSHKDSVNCARFHPNGMAIASCSSDGSIHVWDLRMNGQLLQCYEDAHNGPINAIDFHKPSGGEFLISGSDDGQLKIWDLKKGSIVYTLGQGFGGNTPVKCVKFSKRSKNNYFASGCSNFFSTNPAEENLSPNPQENNLVLLWKTNFIPEYYVDGGQNLEMLYYAKKNYELFLKDQKKLIRPRKKEEIFQCFKFVSSVDEEKMQQQQAKRKRDILTKPPLKVIQQPTFLLEPFLLENPLYTRTSKKPLPGSSQ